MESEPLDAKTCNCKNDGTTDSDVIGLSEKAFRSKNNKFPSTKSIDTKLSKLNGGTQKTAKALAAFIK